MKTLVLLKMVPDVVEELEIDAGGKTLDPERLRMILSESDDHALEEALLLKERYGGTVTAIAIDAPELDNVLFSALAKGADRAVKITGAAQPLTTGESAYIFAGVLAGEPGLAGAEIILTGVQAIDDLDGLLANLLAYELDLPSLSIITRLSVDTAARTATALKECPGGVHGEFEVPLPAVLAIQAAEKPPRYVPVAKLRAAMKSRKIEEVPVPEPLDGFPPLIRVLAISKPQLAGRAEMLEGPAEQIAGRLCSILAERGLL